MQYISPEIAFYITITTNILYAIVFTYHFIKKESNKSLMIVTGCLCLTMIITHVFIAYKDGLDQTSPEFYTVAVNYYLLWMILNSVTMLAIFMLHRRYNIKAHDVVIYVFRCLFISSLLNGAMHIDIIELGNRQPYGLWTFYSYAENILNVFMFFSILIARKWSEVFKWLQSAHTH